MKKLRLDFNNRIVSIVSDQKTVIAFMDNDLRKKDFLDFFPDQLTYEHAENVTFDFENELLCLKPPQGVLNHPDKAAVVRRIPLPSIAAQSQKMLSVIGWNES